MNTLACLTAVIAALWVATWCFNTLSQAPLGVAALGLFFLFIALTVRALADDMYLWRSRDD